jgi:hypothetical protein
MIRKLRTDLWERKQYVKRKKGEVWDTLLFNTEVEIQKLEEEESGPGARKFYKSPRGWRKRKSK